MPDILVVDLSKEAPPPPEFVARLEHEALNLMKAGEADKAMQVLAESRRLGELGPLEEHRPMTAEEVAQHEADQAAAADRVQDERKRAMRELRAKRDRWLSQTDVLALPDAAMPVDLPQAVKDAIAANRPAWRAFRQQLRDYMGTVTDPFDPPPFPDQPASPPVILT